MKFLKQGEFIHHSMILILLMFISGFTQANQIDRIPVTEKLKANKLPATKRIKLKPKAAVIKPKLSLYREGLQKQRVVIKFIDGPKIRIKPMPGIEHNDQKIKTINDRISKTVLMDRLHDEYDQHLIKQKKMSVRKLRKQLTAARKHLSQSPLVGFGKLFGNDTKLLSRLRKNTEFVTRKQSADLANYYWAQVKDTASAVELVNRLNALDVVEIAYLPPVPENADVAPPTPNLQGSQTYLNPAPQGIDALYAWNQPGGKGELIKIVDIESGWNLNHEDLPSMFITDGRIRTGDKGQHGTAVMGVMLAKEDGSGVTGIVPNASGGVVSVRRGQGIWGHYDVAEAVFVGLVNMSEGDVMLIEQHAKGPGNVNCDCNEDQCGYIAMEYWQAEFDMINAASAAGIIVAEAAGNGSVNLDNSRYKDRFDRNVRDSGALFIGAGDPNNNHTPTCWTNHGSRVDVQGYGNSVTTTGYGANGLRFDGNDDIQWYTNSFNGTSSATPVVAGAVAAIQGWQVARGRGPLDWYEMGQLLKSTGTPQGAGVSIGPLPDIKAAMLQQEAAQPSLIQDTDNDGVPDSSYEVEVVLSMDGDLLDSVPARSGFSGDRTRTIGTAGEFLAIERIKMAERSDRPCFIQAEKAHILNNTRELPHANIDICGNRGPTSRSEKFVPTLTTSHDTFIRGVSVCNSKTKNNTRLKGVKLYRTRVESDNTLTRISNPTTFERPNCDDNWRTPAYCPGDSLATKLVVYIEDEGNNEVITGLGLRCKTLDSEEVCISGDCP
ncbi:S8 family serine peptidase [Marinicella sp. S1101]|uniref:S8 family peptidase n=1 Tax=Marinicella marina TaxID=2996016 RepID=UPI002260C1D1|nr:S8 family peptidase [Marinicella marina]MCX7554928.1 S8 family serine peptidase [Marinicella marina]MDJ1141248.1 S8 family peptidase [Marinicella marina]